MNTTQDEEKEFTLLNCLAFDIARKNAQQNNTKIPTWLTTNQETRTQYRQEAIQTINNLIKPTTPYTEKDTTTLETLLHTILGPEPLQKWKQAELEMKRIREQEQNPHAYFA
jgi:hypothetical protein